VWNREERSAEQSSEETKIKAAKKPLSKVGGNVDLNGTQKVSHGTRKDKHINDGQTDGRTDGDEETVGWMDGQLFKLRSFIPLR